MGSYVTQRHWVRMRSVDDFYLEYSNFGKLETYQGVSISGHNIWFSLQDMELKNHMYAFALKISCPEWLCRCW